jgi:glycosyltransferase involved in cell wall biosynthesis
VTALVPRLAGAPDEEAFGALRVVRRIERGRLPLTVTDVLESRRRARALGGPFDVLVAHGSMLAVGLSRARLSAPLVLVYHASLPRELAFLRPRLPLGRDRLVARANEPIARLLERKALRRACRTLVLSEYSRSLVAADHPWAAGAVRTVSGGVDAGAFTPDGGVAAARARLGLDGAGTLLVTIRRAEPRMGLEQLLHATALLGDDVALAIVGGGAGQDRLRGLARRLGLGRRVRFEGRVPETELRDWYRAADVFVLPTVAYEGFGMVTVEALASATPVVGTPIGATPELLAPLDPRLVAADAEPVSLAAAIRGVLDLADGGFRDRCRRYALDRFDWSTAIAGWEQALLEAVAGGGPCSR